MTTDAPAENNDLPRKTCSCGHARGHHFVSPEPSYTFGGWTMILIGITATPTEVRFVCRRCTKVVEVVTDRAEIERIRLYG